MFKLDTYQHDADIKTVKNIQGLINISNLIKTILLNFDTDLIFDPKIRSELNSSFSIIYSFNYQQVLELLNRIEVYKHNKSAMLKNTLMQLRNRNLIFKILTPTLIIESFSPKIHELKSDLENLSKLEGEIASYHKKLKKG